MIRDLRFDEIERSARRKRTARLVVGCVLLSSAVSFGVVRELDVRREYAAIPDAQLGDLESLRARHDSIEKLLVQRHFWGGAFSAREELDDLVHSIHQHEVRLAKLEKKRSEEVARIREEAEAARMRGNVFAERSDFRMALAQFRRALELSDSLGENGWDEGTWEHRGQLLVDIAALEAEEGRDR